MKEEPHLLRQVGFFVVHNVVQKTTSNRSNDRWLLINLKCGKGDNREKQTIGNGRLLLDCRERERCLMARNLIMANLGRADPTNPPTRDRTKISAKTDGSVMACFFAWGYILANQ